MKLTELEKILQVTVRAVLKCLASGVHETNDRKKQPGQAELPSNGSRFWPWRTQPELLKAHLVCRESNAWNLIKTFKELSRYKITLWRTHRWQFFRTTVLKHLRIWEYKSFRICFAGLFLFQTDKHCLCVALWCEISPEYCAVALTCKLLMVKGIWLV